MSVYEFTPSRNEPGGSAYGVPDDCSILLVKAELPCHLVIPHNRRGILAIKDVDGTSVDNPIRVTAPGELRFRIAQGFGALNLYFDISTKEWVDGMGQIPTKREEPTPPKRVRSIRSPEELTTSRSVFVCKSEALSDMEFIKRMNKWMCWDCHHHLDSYMVEDAIWHSCFPEYREIKNRAVLLRRSGHLESQRHYGGVYLCLDCFECRVGRPLVEEDFKDVPVNRTLLFGMKMGARSEKA